MTKTKRTTPTPEEVARLRTVVLSVWQYVGLECEGSVEDNEGAVEVCLDADRPLLSTTSRDPKGDHAFCKGLFARHHFSDCVSAVAKVVRLV